MARILVTGASGFIGSALIDMLEGNGLPARAAYRTRPLAPRQGEQIAVGDVGAGADWRRALDGVSHVVHLAGPAHRDVSERECRRDIVEATAALAAQAEAAGVGRFVFVSSIKAGGEYGGPLREQDPPQPAGCYGKAKLEAERRVLARTVLAPVILRPPLVFAPSARGNFAQLLRLADTPLPLPFGGLENRRSLISLDALLAAIMAVLRAPAGPPGVFYVADAPACSTTEMVTRLREGMGRPARLFAAPALWPLLPAVLTTNLEADDSAFRAAYGYGASAGVDAREKLRLCGAAWKAMQ